MIDIQRHLAKPSKRLLAYLIDIVPIVITLFGIFYLFFGLDEILSSYLQRGEDLEPRIQFLKERNKIRELSFIIWIGYCILMEASPKQGTLGKQIMGIKVVDESGRRMSFTKSARRNSTKLISYLVLLLGFIWILFDKEKQGWHDKIGKTYVVDKDFCVA